MALPTNFAYAQRRSVSHANHNRAQESEVKRLQRALTQAVDLLKKEKDVSAKAAEAIKAAEEERDAARIERDKAEERRAAMEREKRFAGEALTASQEAIKEAKTVMGEQREFIKEQRETMRVVHEQNIKLYGKLDEANSRSVKFGLGGFLVGVLASIIKIF